MQQLYDVHISLVLNSSHGTIKIEKEDPVEKHPVDKSNWLSFATFSWMNSFMYSSYRDGLKESDIPSLSEMEKCRKNTDALEEIWTRERAFSEPPDLGRVLWIYCRRRVFLTTIIYLTSIVLGFIGPVCQLLLICLCGQFNVNFFFLKMITDNSDETSSEIRFQLRFR